MNAPSSLSLPASASPTTRISMGRMMKRIANVYMRTGGAVHIEGAPGMAKSSMALSFARAMQAADPDFGAAYFNASNAQFIDYSGWPMNGTGFLASNAIPLLFQPIPELGIRGVFPALCPAQLVHADTPADRQPIDPDLAYSNSLTRTQLATYTNNIIIIDEASKVQGPDVMAVQALLAYEARTGQWGVNPKTSLRLFIANRVQDNSRDIETPATYDNRVARYEVYLTYKDIKPHWESINMHPSFLAFAGANAGLVLSDTVPAIKCQYSTARSFTTAWEECMTFCQYECGIDGLPDYSTYVPEILPIVAPDEPDQEFQDAMDDFLGIISARCGSAVSSAFQEYILSAVDLPDYEDIVLKPSTTMIPTNAGAAHTVMETLVQGTELVDLDNITIYLMRPEFPRALANTYCTRIMERFPATRLAAQKDFFRMCNALGVGSRMAFRN